MDLYGDLPPAAGETTSGGIAGNQTVSAVQEVKSSSQTKEDVKKSIKSAPSKAPSLLFKPRQAVTGISNAPQVVSAVSSTSAEKTVNAALPSSVNPSQLLDQAPLVKQPLETHKISDNSEQQKQQEVEDFNPNISFDIPAAQAYDPARPNDYIAYCEERLELKRRYVILINRPFFVRL